MQAILKLLEERTGSTPEGLGQTTVTGVIERRMRALGITDQEAYVARLAEVPAELQHLIDDLVVPETWFFRGGELFDWLASHARQQLNDPARQGRPFRVLSVPCSTGEEPLSLAIALTEQGIDHGRWSIDAVDVSSRSIERAGRGVYPELSFRQTIPELRNRYFHPVRKGWEVQEGLRRSIRYQVANLIAPRFLAGEQPFDLILCRNLFIYLSPPARQKALRNLERLLSPGALLAMGHAEHLEVGPGRFRRAGPPGLFLYRRDQPPPAAVAPPVAPRQPVSVSTPTPVFRSADGTALARARREADQGQLDDALASCRAVLARSGPSAEVYCLLGVIHQARQEVDEAVRCLEGALYLEPNHQEALLHLMLLRQQQGDHGRAALLRRRLARATPGGAQ